MKHGGDIADATPLEGLDSANNPLTWVDLSTGIAPWPYPFATPDAASWQRLPQSRALEACLNAARSAYDVPSTVPLVAAPGTQILLQFLPLVLPNARVAIVGPTYSEHEICWRRTAHSITRLVDIPAPEACTGFDVVVVVNPNNPDGRTWSPTALCKTANALACAHEERSGPGLLVVDEAFGELSPQNSLVPFATTAEDAPSNWLVLKSFGKFFGLAGARLGFAIGEVATVTALAEYLGPWAVPGPTLTIGAEALNDRAWQTRARERYATEARKLDTVLRDGGLTPVGGTDLYRLVACSNASALQVHLARHGIWVRIFDYHPGWLRFGLPDGEPERRRLAAALATASIAQPNSGSDTR